MAEDDRNEENYLNSTSIPDHKNGEKSSEFGFKRKYEGNTICDSQMELDEVFDKQTDLCFNNIDLESIENEVFKKKVRIIDSHTVSPSKDLKLSEENEVNDICDVENNRSMDEEEIRVEKYHSTTLHKQTSGRYDSNVDYLNLSLQQEKIANTSKNDVSLDGSLLKNSILDTLYINGHLSNLNDSMNNQGDYTFSDSLFMDSQLEVEPKFFGLPIEVETLIQTYKGIENLYDWQIECLNSSALKNRKNIILSVPTSGGKTLIAEILILKELLCRRCDALLISPYISIVQEKVRDMSSFAVNLNFAVEEYAGNKGKFPPKQKRKRSTVYMATIEKGHSLINSLIEENRFSELGVVIVDEFHMIGEGGHRGAILESLLSKLLFLSGDIQIIGMSATLGNLEDLKKFLNADIYCHSGRPVELKEYVKINDKIMEYNSKAKCHEECFQLVRQFKPEYSETMKASDPDCLTALVLEVIPENSCLVFCPTKQNCENVAVLICSGLPKKLKQYKTDEKMALLAALEAEGNGNVCRILQKTIPYGFAYHHGGLTMDERRLLEEGYSTGTLCCLTCTSTLAAGVNLPARRVILRSPYVGTKFITKNRYKQMVGRAGRAGIDDSGESILIMKSTEFNAVLHLMKSKEEQCFSSLLDENTKGIQALLLSIIGLKIATTIDNLDKFLNGTLLAVQKEHFKIDMTLLRKKALEQLFMKQLIQLNISSENNEEHLSITKLGTATFKGSIDIDLASQLHRDLSRSLHNLVLHNHLHLLYIITPYDAVFTIQPQINIYYKMYMQLSPNDIHAAEVIGIPESYITLMAAGKQPKNLNKEIYDRFYCTLIIYRLWNQHSVWHVSNEFHLHRGVVQNLIAGTTALASSIYHFCKELPEFWAFKLLLEGLVQQLHYCVIPELLPLMELPAVKKGRALQLFKAGYKTLQDLAQADVNHLVKIIPHMSKKIAKQIIDASQMLIIEKVIELKYQADDLLSGLQPFAKV